MEVFYRVFDATSDIFHHYVAGVSDNKKISKPLIKDQFDGDARVGTPQDDRKRILPVQLDDPAIVLQTESAWVLHSQNVHCLILAERWQP
jgi:hypothetical protein